VEKFPSKFDIKFRDLPKSFGCQVSLNVDEKGKNFYQLNKRMY